MENKNRTEIATLGEFGLIGRLTSGFEIKNNSTVKGAGDDAAVIECGEDFLLLSTDLMLEGIDFDLTYFPLKHLGYKAVVVGVSDILAMNGTPQQITVSIGLSARFSVEDADELYQGIGAACQDYGVDLAGGDTSASLTGIVLSITTLGRVSKERIVYRSGAKVNDLICVSGELGSAYMGLRLLDREKRVLEGHPDPQPKFDGYEYLLRRHLKPSARLDIIEGLAGAGIVPTSMIDLSDGLASDLLQICKNSGCGARVYLDRLAIAKETYSLAEELHFDPVVAALNGGDDHELLFTVPLKDQDKIRSIPGIDIIGHITKNGTGAALVTPDGSDIAITAPGISL